LADKKKRLSWSCIIFLVFFLTFAAPVSSVCAAQDLLIPIIVHDGKGREVCLFLAEPAVTFEQQSQGLMHRTSLPSRRGMLFINDKDEMRYFWMKNTHIPLDIIFIDHRFTVVHVHYGAVPYDERTVDSRHPARYVLEINAGEAKECKIKAGVRVMFGVDLPDR